MADDKERPRTEPALSLSTLAPNRPWIAIDGQTYELAVPEDFGLVDQARLNKLPQEMVELGNLGAEISEEQASRLEAIQNQVVMMIVRELPLEVLDRLDISQKTQIIEVFTKLASARVPAQKAKQSRNRTGRKRSRRSRDSTAATRESG